MISANLLNDLSSLFSYRTPGKRLKLLRRCHWTVQPHTSRMLLPRRKSFHSGGLWVVSVDMHRWVQRYTIPCNVVSMMKKQKPVLTKINWWYTSVAAFLLIIKQNIAGKRKTVSSFSNLVVSLTNIYSFFRQRYIVHLELKEDGLRNLPNSYFIYWKMQNPTQNTKVWTLIILSLTTFRLENWNISSILSGST